jgi:hypothetical protein
MKAIKFWGISCVLLLVSVNLQAQHTSLDQLFEKYQGDERFSRVSVSSRMFELFLDIEMDDPDQQALVETVSKLKGLKVLIGKDVPEAPQLYREFAKRPASEMDELMTVSDANKEVQFYIKEASGKISELLMVGFDGEQVMIMSLTGEIDLKEIAALSKKMNIEGFENFRNIDKK